MGRGVCSPGGWMELWQVPGSSLEVSVLVSLQEPARTSCSSLGPLHLTLVLDKGVGQTSWGGPTPRLCDYNQFPHLPSDSSTVFPIQQSSPESKARTSRRHSKSTCRLWLLTLWPGRVIPGPSPCAILRWCSCQLFTVSKTVHLPTSPVAPPGYEKGRSSYVFFVLSRLAFFFCR